MTDDSRIIWSYTEGHLHEWMRGMRQEYQDGTRYDFPDPASLAPDQVDALYHRLNSLVENSDGPRDDMREFAWYVLQDMGLIRDVRQRG
jgi:hypothetical protein